MMNVALYRYCSLGFKTYIDFVPSRFLAEARAQIPVSRILFTTECVFQYRMMLSACAT